MIKVYGIKNCDSVRKAIKLLKKYNIPYTFIDFRESAVSQNEIQEWLNRGADIKTLFNTRGTTYRTLKLKDLDLSDDEKVTWLAKENMLIKRPVILYENKIIVGYNESQYLDEIRIKE